VPIPKEEKRKRDLLMKQMIENLLNKKMNAPNHRLPNKTVTKLVDEYSSSYPWLTEDVIKGRLKRKYKQTSNINKHTQQQLSSQQKSTLLASSQLSPSRNKGGRPKGTKLIDIEHLNRCTNEAKSEIVDEYVSLMKHTGARLPAGAYNKIHGDIKKRRNLPDSFLFPYQTAKKRIQRKTVLDDFAVPIGAQSPLRDAEENITKLLILLGKIGSPVSSGQGVFLINDLIKNTVHQQRLIEYKKKQGISQSDEDLGKIGQNYWYSYLKRNRTKIESKKGRKYDLDRSSWTKYKNFKNMYSAIEEEMVEAGVAISLDEPAWMDQNGNKVNK
jgi:hypothetical protein